MTTTAMRELVAPTGGMQFSRNRADTLVTHRLGSCVALTLYDPESHVGGIVHAMLPLSSAGGADEQAYPCMFVDTGVTALLSAVIALGARKSRLIAHAAGAGELLQMDAPLRIGHRNRVVLYRVLSKNGISLHSTDLGGNAARTMTLDLADGQARVFRDGLDIALRQHDA